MLTGDVATGVVFGCFGIAQAESGLMMRHDGCGWAGG